jgi:hypothetical protein
MNQDEKEKQIEQIYHEYQQKMKQLEMQQTNLLEEYERRIDELKIVRIEEEIKNE